MANVSWTCVGLLVISNAVMTYCWYGHLKTMGDAALWKVLLVSWAIAFLEYCFMIPANRIGAKTMTLDQLKITQEAISLLVFVPFSILVMKQGVNWNYAAAAGCIIAAVFFIFRG